ncbi:MAG: hypothetical protein JXB13_22040 [Phycisphaerae bacterium]|nr:hypothetical protein [Phycisphaerae bacterium]
MEPLCTGEAGDPGHRLSTDFQRIRELGFNSVLAAHLADDRREAVMQAARTHGLTTILTDPVLHRYCLAAPVDDRAVNIEERLRNVSAFGADILPLVLHIGEIADDDGLRRAAHIAEEAAQCVPSLPLAATVRTDPPLSGDRLRHITPIVRVCEPADPSGPFNPPSPLPQPGMMMIPVSGRSEDLAESVRTWLGMYHAGLSAGATEGVILDAWAEVRGRQEGLVDAADSVAVARAAAVKRILHRACAWAPHLRGSAVVPLDGWQCYDRNLRVTLFTRQHRRWVLLWNVSASGYSRSEVFLPAEAGGAAADRAVEVPGDPGVVGGRVFDARRGRILVPVELAPGDAMLVELFASSGGAARPD